MRRFDIFFRKHGFRFFRWTKRTTVFVLTVTTPSFFTQSGLELGGPIASLQTDLLTLHVDSWPCELDPSVTGQRKNASWGCEPSGSTPFVMASCEHYRRRSWLSSIDFLLVCPNFRFAFQRLAGPAVASTFIYFYYILRLWLPIGTHTIYKPAIVSRALFVLFLITAGDVAESVKSSALSDSLPVSIQRMKFPLNPVFKGIIVDDINSIKKNRLGSLAWWPSFATIGWNENLSFGEPVSFSFNQYMEYKTFACSHFAFWQIIQ